MVIVWNIVIYRPETILFEKMAFILFHLPLDELMVTTLACRRPNTS